jgi:antitoxin component of MazEF toxin-antitoxin module
MKVEIRKIDNSDVLVLPREFMQRLDLKSGQELYLTELSGGGFFKVTPYDPSDEDTIAAADEIMDQYRDTLTGLTK